MNITKKNTSYLLITVLVFFLIAFATTNFSYAANINVDSDNKDKIVKENRQVFRIDSKTNEIIEINMDEIRQNILSREEFNGKIPSTTTSYTPKSISIKPSVNPMAVEGAMVRISSATNHPYNKV